MMTPATGDTVGLQGTSTHEREAFESLLVALMQRVPVHLHQTFQDAVQSLQDCPMTGPELLDAMDRAHMGLGVAIGRGATGEDQNYQQIGQIVCWLYEELGRPPDAQYAVVARAAAIAGR